MPKIPSKGLKNIGKDLGSMNLVGAGFIPAQFTASLFDTYGYVTAELAVPDPEKDTLGLF